MASDLQAYGLPASAAQFLKRRIEQLPADARLWGTLLCLVDQAMPLGLSQCVTLMAPRMSAGRSYRAIARLVAEQLISDDDELPRPAREAAPPGRSRTKSHRTRRVS